MLDKYNREINYLRVSITDRCNLRCVYCRPKEGISLQGHDDILRYEEILRVVAVAVKMGLVKVRVTGGEPLVRRGCVEFLAALKKINGLRDVSLTTNGILLEDFAPSIYAAGISRINVSLDSLNPDKYSRITNGGSLQAVLRGIARAEEVGFAPIKINTVAIRGFNEDEVLDFAQLAIRKPYQVRFIELMPIGQHQLTGGHDYIPGRELIEKISRHYALEKIPGKKDRADGPAKIFRIRKGQGEIGFINPVSDHFCSTCNRLRLTSDGKLRVCLLSEKEIDLKKALRDHLSDAELERLLVEAIFSKPQKHDLVCTENSLRKCRNMSAIGG
ncbi:MAG TPA: GTP 3',8-cyclase MoaA [Smithella sp.]|nr:GTP 3',8-cyclase MoaA [Smithella sp.]